MSNRILTLAAVLGCTFALTACQRDLARTEGVTSFAGNAQAINRANQTADPWAKHAHDRNIRHDGQRLGEAVRRYKENSVETDTGIEAPTTAD